MGHGSNGSCAEPVTKLSVCCVLLCLPLREETGVVPHVTAAGSNIRSCWLMFKHIGRPPETKTWRTLCLTALQSAWLPCWDGILSKQLEAGCFPMAAI